MSYKKINAFGLDISDYSVAIVFLNKKRKVEVCLREKLPFGVVVNGKVKDKQALSEVLAKLKEKAGADLPTDKVVFSLPESKVFAHVFSVPTSLSNDPKVILKLAQEHIPLDLNESIFDYKIIKDKTLSKNEKKIYFVAVEEKLVFDYLEVLTLVKLKPIAIDIEQSSIARALEDHKKQVFQKALAKKIDKKKEQDEKDKKKKAKKDKDKKDEDKKDEDKKDETAQEEEQSVEELIKETLPSAEVAIDMGAKHSVATIFYNENVFPSISIPIGGHTFTQIIQDKLKIKDFEEAQKTKKKLTLKSEQYKKIQSDFEAEQDKIVKELQSLIAYFEKNNEVIVKTLHVSGGTSKIPGFYEYIKENFEIEVKKAEPQIKSKESLDTELFVTAIGLALRGIAQDPVTAEINLLPAHQKRLLVEQQAKSAIIYSSLVVLFVSSLLIASFNIVLSNLYFDLEGLEKANTSFQKIVEGQRYQDIQTHIQELNDNAQIAKQTLEETYSINSIYQYFYANLPNAIVINQFNYNNTEGTHKIEVNGFALERDKVIDLQERLQGTPFYTNLVAPLSNLLKQSDIYFAFTFDLDLAQFQKYLEEEERKAIEEAKKAREAALNELHGTAGSPSNENGSAGALTTGDGATIKPIIDLDDNLINNDNLEDFNVDITDIYGKMEEVENIEDQQIKEVLENSNEEYPFKEKIHEKVGDIFVIEQEFHAGEDLNQENN